MTYQGRVSNGVVVLENGATLPDGTVVRVEAVVSPQGAEAQSSWADELLELAGSAQGLPSDLARNHDHYLYGTPKR